jgi:hypothetical protein
VGQVFADFTYDGILSLSLPVEDGGRPSFLKSMSQQGTLDALMFSLDLNLKMKDLSTETDTTGKLVIGANDKLYHHPDTKRISIVKSENLNLTGSWVASMDSLVVKFKELPLIKLPLPGKHFAVFNPAIASIILPRGYGNELLTAFEVITSGRINMIPCPQISELPDLLFTFGDGQTVKITSHEYVVTYEFNIDPRPPVQLCHVAIADSVDYPEYPDNVIVLGSPFLRGFHSIWDWGSQTIGCKYDIFNQVRGLMT